MAALISPFQRQILEIYKSRDCETSTLDLNPLVELPSLASPSHRYSFIYGELKSLWQQGFLDPAAIHPSDPHKTTFLRRKR